LLPFSLHTTTWLCSSAGHIEIYLTALTLVLYELIHQQDAVPCDLTTGFDWHTKIPSSSDKNCEGSRFCI